MLENWHILRKTLSGHSISTKIFSHLTWWLNFCSFQIQINVVVFVLALRNTLSSSQVRLRAQGGNTTTAKASAQELLRKVKVGLRGSAILLPLLGLTWVFGLLVFNRDTIVFKYLFAICNSLQGVVVFVFHVLINTKVAMLNNYLVCMYRWSCSSMQVQALKAFNPALFSNNYLSF